MFFGGFVKAWLFVGLNSDGFESCIGVGTGVAVGFIVSTGVGIGVTVGVEVGLGRGSSGGTSVAIGAGIGVGVAVGYVTVLVNGHDIHPEVNKTNINKIKVKYLILNFIHSPPGNYFN